MNNKIYYRVIYCGNGIYEALKENVTIDTWKIILSSEKMNWLPKPTIYNANNKSYFTKLGYDKFIKETLPFICKYLSKDKINFEKYEELNNIVYSDEYQVIVVENK